MSQKFGNNKISHKICLKYANMHFFEKCTQKAVVSLFLSLSLSLSARTFYARMHQRYKGPSNAERNSQTHLRQLMKNLLISLMFLIGCGNSIQSNLYLTVATPLILIAQISKEHSKEHSKDKVCY